jgi:hypothetical protein
MWVAELDCEAGHGFEGYFGSKDDFESQRARGLVSCPVCGSAQVERRLSAPRINVGAPAPQAGLHELVARLRAGSEDVGRRFATEARRMHEGEAPPRAIRGQTSGDELMALLDDGIPVLPLPDLDPAH